MKADFTQVPAQFQNIIQTLRIYDYRMNEGIQIKQKKAQDHVQKLIKWMNENHLCEPFWIDLLYMLVREFKIAILPNFRKSFRKILNFGWVHDWNSKAAHLIRLIKHIASQIDQDFDYEVFGLTELSTLMEKSIIIMNSGIKFEIEDIKLSEMESKMYRFLFKGRVWAKRFERICPSLQGRHFDERLYREERKDYEKLKVKEEEIILKYQKLMTSFQTMFYKTNRQYYRKAAQEFKKIIYERQKDLPKQTFVLIPYDPLNDPLIMKDSLKLKDSLTYKESLKKETKIQQKLKDQDYEYEQQPIRPKLSKSPAKSHVSIQKSQSWLNKLDDVINFVDRFNEEIQKNLDDGEFKHRYKLRLDKIIDADEPEGLVKIEEGETLGEEEQTVYCKFCKRQLDSDTKETVFQTDVKKFIDRQSFKYSEQSHALSTPSQKRYQPKLDIWY